MKRVLFLILISILITAAGRYLIYSGKANLKQSTQTTLPITKASPIPSDETTNWETITNSKFGYVIKYPPDWSFSANQHTNPLITNLATFQSDSTCNITDNLCSTIQLNVENNDNKNDLTPRLSINLQGSNPDRITNKTSIKINGEDASEFDFFGANYRSAIGTLIHIVVINHNGRKYVLSFKESPLGGDSIVDNTKWKNKHIFDKMLSTFKFTGGEITKEEAVNIVLSLSEVNDYVSRVKNSRVEYSHDSSDGQKIIVHVYEQLPDHTATFNWFNVDKATKQVTKEF